MEILPEVERARILCGLEMYGGDDDDDGVVNVERDTRRTFESSEIERTIFPSAIVPLGTSQTYMNLSDSAVEMNRDDGSCDASH